MPLVPKFFNHFSRISPVTWLILVIALVALLLRVWNLSESVLFLGDQGRDALIVANIFQDFDPVFIGPVTSVGNMYLGPAYYYFMLPFLLMSYPSPLGPAYAIAILGAVTVFMLYYWGRELVGKRAAAIAAVLLAFNAVAVELSRFSWNPNPAPFVTLVLMWAVWRAWQGRLRYWLLVAVSISVLLQLHYVAALAGVSAGIVWLVQGIRFRSDKNKLIEFAKISLVMSLILMLSFTPLVLFDIKHNWINAKGFQTLVQKDESFGKGSFSEIITKTTSELHGRSGQLFITSTVGHNNQQIISYALLIIVFLVVVIIWRLAVQKAWHKQGVWIPVLFCLVGVLGLALYRHDVYFHYIIFLFPAMFLFFGWVLAVISRIKIFIPIIIGLLAWYSWHNYSRLDFSPTGQTLEQLSEASSLIHSQIEPGEPYILVLLASHRDLYGMNYRYFLNTDREKAPLSPERYQEAETLVLINEERLPNPTDLPIFELMVFDYDEPSQVINTKNGIEILFLRKDGI